MTDDLLNRGIVALKAGRKAEARGLLAQLVEQEPRHELGWLWLSGAVDTEEDRRVCLENVLAINPNNDLAQRGLETLQQSSPPGPAGATDAGRPRPAEGDDGGADEEIAGLLQQAVAAIKNGDKERGKQLLIEVIEREEDNEAAWLWMCRCVTDRDVKRECFERVLAINPDNQNAVEGLKRLDVLLREETSTNSLPTNKFALANEVGLLEEAIIKQETELRQYEQELAEAKGYSKNCSWGIVIGLIIAVIGWLFGNMFCPIIGLVCCGIVFVALLVSENKEKDLQEKVEYAEQELSANRARLGKLKAKLAVLCSF